MRWLLVLWIAALLLSSEALGLASEERSWWSSVSSPMGLVRIAIGPEGDVRTQEGQCLSSEGEPCTEFPQPQPREQNGHFRVMDIRIAPNGDVWTVGSFAWTVDFAPEGPPQVRRAGENDSGMAFLRKQAPDGRLLFVRTWGGGAEQLFLSKAGVVVLGSFRGTVDFDPGAGKDVRTNPARRERADDPPASHFLVRYTEKGDYLGAWVLPSWLHFSVAVSHSGELVIAGSFSGSEDLDPSAGQRLFRAAGARDAFVTVMRPGGTYGFTRTLPALRISDVRYAPDGTLWALANPLGPDGQTAFDYYLLRVSQKGMEVVRTYPWTSPSYGSGLAILETFPDGGLLLGGQAGRSLLARSGHDFRVPEQRSRETSVLMTRLNGEGSAMWTVLFPPSTMLESAVAAGSRVCVSLSIAGGPYDFSLSGPALPVDDTAGNRHTSPLISCIKEQTLRSKSLTP
jgi:hypothetical protein